MRKYNTWDVAIATVASVCAVGMVIWAVWCVRNITFAAEAPEVIISGVPTVVFPSPMERAVDIEATDDETIEETPVVKYFNVPLDEDLQDYIFLLCENYSIDPSVVIAMIERESSFRSSVMGDSGKSYGLMQIQKRWHEARMERLGVTDLLDPYQNVAVGIDYLGELFICDNGIEWALMAYNGGYNYAYKMVTAGKVSDYANGILERAVELRAELDVVEDTYE